MANPATTTHPAVQQPDSGAQLLNGAKFVANLALVPGASQIVEGNVGSGILYAGSGLAARYFLPSMFGPLGWLAIGLDSYSVSASGKHLWDYFAPTPPAPTKSGRPE
jgi:hypothetical protein